VANHAVQGQINDRMAALLIPNTLNISHLALRSTDKNMRFNRITLKGKLLAINELPKLISLDISILCMM